MGELVSTNKNDDFFEMQNTDLWFEEISDEEYREKVKLYQGIYENAMKPQPKYRSIDDAWMS